jgi:poly(A) polymerase
MTVSLADADWLSDRRLLKLFRALGREGDEIWVVGGAVRNTLMGLPVADIDLATTARPETVMERARAAHLRPVPTGIDHGTVTVVVDSHPFEVTTLRADVETHGRHATVAFGRDWNADAHRRDFTVNALYVSPDGTVHDFVGGVADCRDRRIRFIGDPHARIAEDYLRILRFFRFHAAYGDGAPDAAGLAACAELQEGIARLSAERLGQELMKFVMARQAVATASVMAEAGILARVLGEAANIARFASTVTALEAIGHVMDKADAVVLMAALVADGRGLGQRLRLSNAQTERMGVAEEAALAAAAVRDDHDLRVMRHRFGATGAVDGLILANGLAAEELARRIGLVSAFDPGSPPVRGRDLKALGLDGPEIGEKVRQAEQLWLDSDFRMTRAELLAAIGH